MSTDEAWEQWGQRDPYFGVITDPKYRRSAISEEAKREFFESGAAHVQYVLTTIRQHIDPYFTPRRILDFGCGVGRLVVSFARFADEVIGLDVSRAMLHEAQLNCAERQLQNVQLLRSDDDLSTLSGSFDLIHSSIVFQHIPVERGRTILTNLLRHLRPGGAAAIHLTYSKIRFAATYGIPPTLDTRSPESARETTSSVANLSADADPEIQMNIYNVNEVFFLLQSYGAQRLHIDFTDHGGELGLFLYFGAPNAGVGVRPSSNEGPARSP